MSSSLIYQFLCVALQQQTLSLRLLLNINTESLSAVFQKRKQQLSIMHYRHIKASDFPLPIIHLQAKSLELPLKRLQRLLHPLHTLILFSSEVQFQAHLLSLLGLSVLFFPLFGFFFFLCFLSKSLIVCISFPVQIFVVFFLSWQITSCTQVLTLSSRCSRISNPLTLELKYDPNFLFSKFFIAALAPVASIL